MDVEESPRGKVQERLPQDLAVGGVDDGLRRQRPDGRQRIRGVDLVLKKKAKDAFNVSGVVVDAIDGKPISNVRLRFWSLGDRDEEKTDGSGDTTVIGEIG